MTLIVSSLPCMKVGRRDTFFSVLNGHQVSGEVDHLAAVVHVEVVETSFLRLRVRIPAQVTSLHPVHYQALVGLEQRE